MSTPSKGLSEFVAEATEILDTLAQDLLTLDERRGEDVDPDLLNGIFRAAHSLKGLAGMFGQDRVAQLAHRSEDLLDRLRLGKVELGPAALDGLIATIDVFQALLAESARGEASPEVTQRSQALADHLLRLAEGAPRAPEDPLAGIGLDPGVRAVLTEYEEHRLRENLKKGLSLWKVRAAFDLSDFDQRLQEVNAKLKPLGEVISTLPSAEPGAGTGIAFDLLFGTRRSEDELRAAVAAMPVALQRIAQAAPPSTASAPPPQGEAAAAPARPERRKRKRGTSRATGTPPIPERSGPAEPALEAAEPTLPAVDEESAALAPVTPLPTRTPPVTPKPELDASLRSLTQTVRVDIRRLDALMNAVGELLLTRANLQRLAETARMGGVHAISKLWAQELHRETRQLERKLDELQKGILDVRMVPLGQVFDKLARLVRRIARSAGKEIDFVITGGEVELDKLIVEELSDPLMHIIRNAIDHGVEPPEVRVQNGKPRRATIALRALQQGNHVVIEIQDDGPGIDLARVREVAIARGLITAVQADEMSVRELQNLIFLPGFSTARSVSQLSGRGVGLDVVKTNIANLSGIIDLHSTPGQGTLLSITLPLTLAIIRALVVSVSGRTYAVPLNSVLEILSVESSEIRTIERREVVTLRGQTLPFVRLCRLFGLPEVPLKRHYVVVVGLAQERLGIAVDELVGQQDIVTKPLGGRLQHVRGISGATDLGNRRTVLVLDVGALVEEVLAPERRADFI
ncbi:MAG: chemotaxis protein CheA [Myxococcaceae bacterium]|nr:chemotaxis protein CheA [Myxococcaceae bacterium]